MTTQFAQGQAVASSRDDSNLIKTSIIQTSPLNSLKMIGSGGTMGDRGHRRGHDHLAEGEYVEGVAINWPCGWIDPPRRNRLSNVHAGLVRAGSRGHAAVQRSATAATVRSIAWARVISPRTYRSQCSSTGLR